MTIVKSYANIRPAAQCCKFGVRCLINRHNRLTGCVAIWAKWHYGRGKMG